MIIDTTEIEQFFLSALLQNNTPIDLKERDFAIAEHYNYFKQIQSGKTLKDYIGTKDYDYLRAVSDLAVTSLPSQIEEYAETLREQGRKRKLSGDLQDALKMIEEKQSSEIMAHVLKSLSNEADTQGIKTALDVRQEIINEIELPKDCYTTGIRAIDAGMAGGLYSGFTYGFCGAEKSGKTTLAHTVSFNLNTPHVYFAMEMGSKQIEQRNVARSIGKNSLDFLSRKIDKETVEESLINENVYYADAIGWTAEQITHNAQMAKIKYGITGFIVDYWQLVQPDNKTFTEEKHLRDVAQHIANFARKNNLWCILLAQMNKDGALFGGNGIRKACDQLYMVKPCETDCFRWLNMDASRYTQRSDIGSESSPALVLDQTNGPYFKDA